MNLDGKAPSEDVPQAGGWTFSKDLSPETLAEIQGLIAANGLANSSATANPNADEQAAAADAAFARMVAANPGATVVGGGSAVGMGAPPVDDSEERKAAREAAFQQMLAENPGAEEVCSHPGTVL
jgi:hypothetical protein